MSEVARQKLYALSAEFDTPESLEKAAHTIMAAGYTRAEAYSPFIVEGLARTLGSKSSHVAPIVLFGGIAGALTGFGMCWYANVISFPLNIGGRPHNSWPAWIPITFELTVLFAALSGAIGMLILNGLPRLHHPVFDIPHFDRASTDRFFLCIEAADPLFNPAQLRVLLEPFHPLLVTEVWQ